MTRARVIAVSQPPRLKCHVDPITLINDRAKELGQNLRAILTVYMTWHTFYWTVNVAVLGWIAGGAAAVGKAHQVIFETAVFFGVMSFVSSFSSLSVLKALLELARETTNLNEQALKLTRAAHPESPLDAIKAAVWPEAVTKWGLSVNMLVTLALSILWGLVALQAR